MHAHCSRFACCARRQAAIDPSALSLRSPWYGSERPKWLGPVSFSYPPYLEGGAPGDYGYDVLQLGSDPAAFERYFELELLHARCCWLWLVCTPGRTAHALHPT
jgi:light-harvesting complex II chlorophyll a/b binding protein 7